MPVQATHHSAMACRRSSTFQPTPEYCSVSVLIAAVYCVPLLYSLPVVVCTEGRNRTSSRHRDIVIYYTMFLPRPLASSVVRILTHARSARTCSTQIHRCTQTCLKLCALSFYNPEFYLRSRVRDTYAHEESVVVMCFLESSPIAWVKNVIQNTAMNDLVHVWPRGSLFAFGFRGAGSSGSAGPTCCLLSLVDLQTNHTAVSRSRQPPRMGKYGL